MSSSRLRSGSIAIIPPNGKKPPAGVGGESSKRQSCLSGGFLLAAGAALTQGNVSPPTPAGGLVGCWARFSLNPRWGLCIVPPLRSTKLGVTNEYKRRRKVSSSPLCGVGMGVATLSLPCCQLRAGVSGAAEAGTLVSGPRRNSCACDRSASASASRSSAMRRIRLTS